MPIAALTQPEVRANSFTIEQVALDGDITTPSSGNITLYELTDGSLKRIDSAGVKSTLFGSTQQLAKSPKGALIKMKTAETTVTCSGATSTATNLIPAKCKLKGVAIRVITAITGATSFTIGDGSDVDRWGTGISIAIDTATSESDATADPGGWSATALSVVLTATGSNFTAGVVRVTAFYEEYDGATS